MSKWDNRAKVSRALRAVNDTPKLLPLDAMMIRILPLFMTKRVLSGFLILAALVGCSKNDTAPPAPQTTAEQAGATNAMEPGMVSHEPAIDVCKLLSHEEIASVQGEAPARTQLVGESSGQLTVSQCNFLLPSGSNSMAVRVVERGKGPNARDPKEVWKETFHRPPPDPATARYARKSEKVDGLGEEAFWLGNAKSGGLHVLTGNRYIRINVGGQEEIPAKIAKCSKLSQMVLPRLDAAE